MRKYFNRICWAVMGLTLAVPGAQVANADNETFVAAAHALGFPQWDDVLIRLARHSCYSLDVPAGVWPDLTRRGPDDVTRYVMKYGAVEWDPARQFVVLAVNEYCPQYSGLVGA
jgi:hypothetical protein